MGTFVLLITVFLALGIVLSGKCSVDICVINEYFTDTVCFFVVVILLWLVLIRSLAF